MWPSLLLELRLGSAAVGVDLLWLGWNAGTEDVLGVVGRRSVCVGRLALPYL